MTVDFERMMKEQYDLQVAMYNGHHPGASDNPEERVVYIKDMALAALDEVHEALGEVGWKPWAKSRHINRDAFVSELIDTMQFVMNMFAAVDADAEEVCTKLFKKHLINWQRLNGYTGLEKCKKCKRALDDLTTHCEPGHCMDDKATA